MEYQSSNKEIGKRISTLRKQQQLTQAQLAEETNLTSKHISEIERGVTGISIDTQIALGDKLHCSLDYLIKGNEYKSVDSILPSSIIEILLSDDEKEIELLLTYLKLYERLRKKN